MNTAPAVMDAVIIYQRVFRLSAMAAISVQNAIFRSVITARFTASVRKYGERRWTYEADEL